MVYGTTKDAIKAYKVSVDTLRRWANSGKIEFTTTKGGHRRYLLPEEKKEGEKIIYARVSSKKQESDLNRQIQLLREKYPKHKVVSDIASGITFERKGFTSILEKVFRGQISEVVVASKDRITRLGFDLLQFIFKFFHTSLVVEDSTPTKSSKQELAEDLLSIVTIFTAKFHGSRKYKKDKSGKKD